MPVSAPPTLRVTPAPVEGTSTPEVALIDEPSPTEEEPPVRTEVSERVETDEQPLATWARVAIVVVALVAFFAVSLIATKQV
jgi:hypothetical protein